MDEEFLHYVLVAVRGCERDVVQLFPQKATTYNLIVETHSSPCGWLTMSRHSLTPSTLSKLLILLTSLCGYSRKSPSYLEKRTDVGRRRRAVRPFGLRDGQDNRRVMQPQSGPGRVRPRKSMDQMPSLGWQSTLTRLVNGQGGSFEAIPRFQTRL
jgi:hypothetical protein